MLSFTRSVLKHSKTTFRYVSKSCIGVPVSATQECIEKAKRVSQQLGIEFANTHAQQTEQIEQPVTKHNEADTDLDEENTFMLNFYDKKLPSLSRFQTRYHSDSIMAATADFYAIHMQFCADDQLPTKGRGMAPLFKAVRIPDREPEQVHIVNATGGLGKEAYLLAYAGYNVTIVEKDPVLFYLLHEGYNHAMQQLGLYTIMQRIKIVHGDVTQLTEEQLGAPVDVFYADMLYDPLHYKKWEKVKSHYDKLQVVLRAYSGSVKDEHIQAMIDAGKRLAKHKIVFKWPKTVQEKKSPEIQAQFNACKKTTSTIYDIINLSENVKED